MLKRMLMVAAAIGIGTIVSGESQAQNLSACINQANQNYYADNNECNSHDERDCNRDCYLRDSSDPHSVQVYNRCIQLQNNCVRQVREHRQRCFVNAQNRRNRQVRSCQNHYQ